MYVRGEDPKMPEVPHATFENSTIVGPDNALQAGYPGVDELCTRVKLKNCRLIVLNFSQPQGTPSSGIICCGCKDGRQLHVDLEDCVLMGYKVFGTRAGEVSYSIKGKVSAYVQYRQPVPQGFERLRYWPVEAFSSIGPPRIGDSRSTAQPKTSDPARSALAVAEVRKKDDRVSIQAGGTPTVIDVVCPSGIGGATIVLKEGPWPDRIVIRFSYGERRPFVRLEGFNCALGVLGKSGDSKKIAHTMRQGAEGPEVELPITEPAKGFTSMSINWVDAYR